MPLPRPRPRPRRPNPARGTRAPSKRQHVSSVCCLRTQSPHFPLRPPWAPPGTSPPGCSPLRSLLFAAAHPECSPPGASSARRENGGRGHTPAEAVRSAPELPRGPSQRQETAPTAGYPRQPPGRDASQALGGTQLSLWTSKKLPATALQDATRGSRSALLGHATPTGDRGAWRPGSVSPAGGGSASRCVVGAPLQLVGGVAVDQDCCVCNSASRFHQSQNANGKTDTDTGARGAAGPGVGPQEVRVRALGEGAAGSPGPTHKLGAAQGGPGLGLGGPASPEQREGPAGPLLCLFTDALPPQEAQKNPWPEKPIPVSGPA